MTKEVHNAPPERSKEFSFEKPVRERKSKFPYPQWLVKIIDLFKSMFSSDQTQSKPMFKVEKKSDDNSGRVKNFFKKSHTETEEAKVEPPELKQQMHALTKRPKFERVDVKEAPLASHKSAYLNVAQEILRTEKIYLSKLEAIFSTKEKVIDHLKSSNDKKERKSAASFYKMIRQLRNISRSFLNDCPNDIQGSDDILKLVNALSQIDLARLKNVPHISMSFYSIASKYSSTFSQFLPSKFKIDGLDNLMMESLQRLMRYDSLLQALLKAIQKVNFQNKELEQAVEKLLVKTHNAILKIDKHHR